MNRLFLPLLALTLACTDKTDTDTGTDTDGGTDTDVGTDTDLGTDTDGDTTPGDVTATVYVADTANQPISGARVTLDNGDWATTDASGFAVLETLANDSIDVVVSVEGFTRHYETAAVVSGEAAVMATLNPVEIVTITSAANNTMVTADDGLVFRLNGGFEGDRRGNEVLTDVEISVFDTPERLRALPPAPSGYTVVAAADLEFSRDGDIQQFVGNAQITFPPPVGLDPARYRELEAFYFDDDDGRVYKANGSGSQDCAEDYLNDRTPGTLTVNVCHLTVWALMLPIRDEVCVDVDVTSDGETPVHPVRLSAVSACGEGVATSEQGRGRGRVCLPHCGSGDQAIRVDTIDTSGGAPAVAAASVRVSIPPADEIDGDVAASAAVFVDSQDSDGFTVAEGDCDDANGDVFPGADDPIDAEGLDSNCDGVDGVDQDGDGYSSVLDCDDSDRSVRPGRMDNGLIGVSDAGRDNDCDGAIDEDGDDDQDGFINIDFGGLDCNDRLRNVYPGAIDESGDGIDSDCDGFDGDQVITDIDGDGASAEVDCNDRCFDIFPGAVERCDGVDTDCDGRPNISTSGRDSCLDGGIYDDTYTGSYRVEVVQDGDVVDSCSSSVTVSIEDGRGSGELAYSGDGTDACSLQSALGAARLQLEEVQASVAPWGMASGTFKLSTGSDADNAPLTGLVRSGRLSADGSFGVDDATLGPVTIVWTLAATRASEPTNALADDADFDGVKTEDDCDDTDPNVRPGAVEACNGVDDNCNDDIDENACPVDLPNAGLFVVDFSTQYHTGFGDSRETPPPPSIALLVEDELSATAFENPIFVAQPDATLNVVSSMTVDPPGEGGAVSGTLTIQSDSAFPSGILPWTGTANGDGFTGIAVHHNPRLNRWTHVVLTASAAAGPTDNDADFDGTPADVDCDDSDPTRRFDAHEVCDGIDNDCDGMEDFPLDDVCPIMPWTGGSFSGLTFSVLSDDGIDRWSDSIDVDVNIEADGAFAMENPIFQASPGASINILSMSMGEPDDLGSVGGVLSIESTVEGVESGDMEWTGHVDAFGISGFALLSSGPRRWTHIAISQTRSGL